MAKENLTEFVALRCYPEWKKDMKEEAQRKGMTLSDFLFECIEKGYEIVKQQNQ